jgi:hypothetical protein
MKMIPAASDTAINRVSWVFPYTCVMATQVGLASRYDACSGTSPEMEAQSMAFSSTGKIPTLMVVLRPFPIVPRHEGSTLDQNRQTDAQIQALGSGPRNLRQC